ENRPGTTVLWQADFEIKALAHGQAEARARTGLDGMSIHSDEPGLRFPSLDPENRCRSSVNHPQTDAPATLDLHHLGIRKRAVVGKIGIPVVVIEIHRHAIHGTMVHARHITHVAAPMTTS